MTQKINVEVEVTKEAYELGEGLKGVVVAIRTALVDGWQPGTDIPQILVDSLSALTPAVMGAEQIMQESKEFPEEFATGLMLKMKELGFLFVKK